MSRDGKCHRNVFEDSCRYTNAHTVRPSLDCLSLALACDRPARGVVAGAAKDRLRIEVKKTGRESLARQGLSAGCGRWTHGSVEREVGDDAWPVLASTSQDHRRYVVGEEVARLAVDLETLLDADVAECPRSMLSWHSVKVVMGRVAEARANP